MRQPTEPATHCFACFPTDISSPANVLNLPCIAVDSSPNIRQVLQEVKAMYDLSTKQYNSLSNLLRISENMPKPPFNPLKHLHSRIFAPLLFFKLILCAPLILRYLRLRLQCPSRTLDLQYLTFPPHPHSTYLRFSLLDTATSAVKATPSVSGSTTPTSSLPRDPGGEAELQGQGIYKGRD